MRLRSSTFVRASWRRRVAFGCATALAVGLGAIGCASPRAKAPATPATWPLPNIRRASTLPASVVRVAVLPVATHLRLAEPQLTPLDEAWHTALVREGRVEAVAVSRDQLAAWLGARQLSSDGLLPADLLPTIAARTGAQAVVFADLTTYSPYPPLALGLRARLTQISDGATLWACDEIFDGRNAALVQAIAAGETRPAPASAKSAPALQSPRRLATFATAALAASWPTR